MRSPTALLLLLGAGLASCGAAWADDGAIGHASRTRAATQPQRALPDVRSATTATSALYADASGVRGHGFDGDVIGKVGIEFKAAHSRFNIHYGGLGLRLSGDTRMTLRVKRGGLSVGMHRAF